VSARIPRRELSEDDVRPQPPGVYPGRAPLDGRYARLEPVDPRRHAADLWAAIQGGPEADRIWDYLGYGPFAAPEAFETWLRGCAGSSDPLFSAIRDGRDGKVAGMASYLEIRPTQGVIEIGHIWFAPSLQNSREATEALYLLMRHALDVDDLGYRRLEWKCNALNERSRSAAARLGFAFEGIFYQHMIVKGRNRDTAWFSILDYEWPAIRANFDTWLAPDNFDPAGRQIRSLGEMNRALRE
jgi:RimJ/RimL family protein N-acetyltransferase